MVIKNNSSNINDGEVSVFTNGVSGVLMKLSVPVDTTHKNAFNQLYNNNFG